jgi:hypothetical protein
MLGSWMNLGSWGGASGFTLGIAAARSNSTMVVSDVYCSGRPWADV